MICGVGLLLASPCRAAGVVVKQSGPSVDVWSAVETLHKCHDIDVPECAAPQCPPHDSNR